MGARRGGGTASPPVLGVDGYRGGWVGAAVSAYGIDWVTAPVGGFGRLAAGSGPAVVGVDMPMGLVDAGWRSVDLLAREELGAARARVFLTPPRPLVELAAAGLPPNDVAQRMSLALTGQGVSRQSLALAPRIADLDAAVTDAGTLGAAGPPVVEVHPELSFAAMPPGASTVPPRRPLPSKKTGRGVAERLLRLRGWLADLGHDLDTALARCPDDVPVDDALDALAAAWSARRWADGTARTIPSGAPARDGRGLPMRLVV